MAMGIPAWAADCSASHPTVATLKAAGAAGVMRYLDPGRNDGTEITLAEIADYHANSFPYGLVMEYSATWLEGGYDVGHADALAALAEEAKLGIPHGVIYLACDFQIMPPQYQGALTTMQGFADGYGGWQYVRPYGSKSFCDWVQANSPARGSWSTFAWSENPDGSFSHAADARLWQYNYWPQDVPVVAGCDYNQILGDWAPRNGETDMTPAESALLTATAKAVVQIGAAVNVLAAAEATRSGLVEHGDGTHYGFDELKADMATVKTALTKIPGGTVDGQAIATAVAAEVKTITWKAS